jgi:hypothetical protein
LTIPEGASVTLWLHHGCPWSIGSGDPRSQKRDLGPTLRGFPVGLVGKEDLCSGLSPYPSRTVALLFLELLSSEYAVLVFTSDG